MKGADLYLSGSELITERYKRIKLKARSKKGFTLVEIMIVITIISILLGIAIPSFINSREKAKSRSCTENLHQINTAKEQLAMAIGLAEGADVPQAQLLPYLKDGIYPQCPAGGSYDIGVVGATPSCSINHGKYPHVFAP